MMTTFRLSPRSSQLNKYWAPTVRTDVWLSTVALGRVCEGEKNEPCSSWDLLGFAWHDHVVSSSYILKMILKQNDQSLRTGCEIHPTLTMALPWWLVAFWRTFGILWHPHKTWASFQLSHGKQPQKLVPGQYIPGIPVPTRNSWTFPYDPYVKNPRIRKGSLGSFPQKPPATVLLGCGRSGMGLEKYSLRCGQLRWSSRPLSFMRSMRWTLRWTFPSKTSLAGTNHDWGALRHTFNIFWGQWKARQLRRICQSLPVSAPWRKSRSDQSTELWYRWQ